MWVCFGRVLCILLLPIPLRPGNAFIERFIGTTRREVGRYFIPFPVESLQSTLSQHVAYYNYVRTHQGFGERPISRLLHDTFSAQDGEVIRRGLLGNTLNYYVREEA